MGSGIGSWTNHVLGDAAGLISDEGEGIDFVRWGLGGGVQPPAGVDWEKPDPLTPGSGYVLARTPNESETAGRGGRPTSACNTANCESAQAA